MRVRGGTARWPVVLASGAAALSLAGVVLAVVLHQSNVGAPGVDRLWIGDVIVGGTYPLLGLALVRRDPRNAVGWLLTSTALIGVQIAGGQWYVRSALVVGEPLPFAALGGWTNAWMWVVHPLLVALVPLLSPSGRLPSPRWRPALGVVLVGAAAIVVAGATGPMPLDAAGTLTNPLAVAPEGVTRPLAMFGLVACFVVGSLAGLSSVALRLRAARGVERVRLLWLLAAGLLLGCSLLVQSVLPARFDDLAWSVGLVGALVALWVATGSSSLLRRVTVLDRTLAALLLGGLVLGTVLVAIAVLDRTGLSDRVVYGLVALVCLLAVSGYEAVQRLVDRLLLGAAADPYAVVLRVGDRLDLASGPTEALGTLVDELRVALRLPYVAIRTRDALLPLIESGAAASALDEHEVLVQGEPVASLLLGRRHGRPLAPAEVSLVADVGRRAGALVQAAVLVDDLQRSRERIVAAREEERRRLRHDLHDGLGPRLAGMALQLDSLAERLAGDPELRGRAERLRSHMRDTVLEVRRVVDALRPPALDELGLLDALREHLESLAGTGHPRMELSAVAELPTLPAAVEVAAYRIAVEAVTNAVRHAGASTVEVRVRAEPDVLVVEVVDDGAGIAGVPAAGVGLVSMRERAAELGGSLEIRRAGAGGTAVRAALPLRTPPRAPAAIPDDGAVAVVDAP